MNQTEFTFNNSSQKPVITINDDEYTLIENQDYELTYNNSSSGLGNTTNAGTITITITGIGNIYIGSITKEYVINKKVLTNPIISIKEETFTGQSITPTLLSVYDGSIDITSLCTIASGSSKTNAGSYNVSITFNSNNKNYENDTFEAQFIINPKSVESLIIQDVTDVPYTTNVGLNGATPSLNIKDGTITLIEGTDYDLEYENNKGEDITEENITSIATINITFKGNYDGERTKTFNIVNSEFTITYITDGESSYQTYHAADINVTLESRTKLGYLGYWNSTNEDFQFGDVTTPDELEGNITLRAIWTPITYNISYVLEGGINNSANITSYTIETPIFTLLDPEEREVAIFNGWYDNSEFEGDAITNIAGGAIGNITLYAKWNYISYNITYELDGGVNNSANLNSITPIESFNLSDPTKTYYDFDGWYKENTFENKITRIENLEDDITIYAKWNLHEYIISYNYNINSSSITNTNVTTYVLNDIITLTNAVAFTYQFDGWYSDSSYTNLITTFNTSAPENITIYGHFTASNTTLTKELNGSVISTNQPGTTSSNISSKIVGESVTATATVNSGYNFDGWYLNDILQTADLTLTFTLTTSTINYVAKYSSYTFNYSSENTVRGSVTAKYTNGTTVTNSSIISNGIIINLTATTYQGYTFIGWYKNNEAYADTLNASYEMTKENVSFEARWIKVSIVSYDQTLGSVSNLNSTYIKGDTATITATPDSNIIFLGWYKGEGSDLTSNAIDEIISLDDDPIKLLSTSITMPATDTIYVALFIENPIRVYNYLMTYTIDEEIYTISYRQINPSITPTFTSNINEITYQMPRYEGYMFAGWYDSYNSDKQLLSNDISTNCTITLENNNQLNIYAIWVSNSNISAGPDPLENVVDVIYPTLVTEDIILNAFEYDEYTFNGWYLNDVLYDNNLETTYNAYSSYKKLIEHNSSFNGISINFVAKYTVSGIVVQSFDNSMGSVSKSYDSSIEKYTITAEPALGYLFDYWEHNEIVYSNNAVTENVENDSGIYIAHFRLRSDLNYFANYYLQNYDDDEYTLSNTITYSNGIKDQNRTITLNEIPSHYIFKEAKILNEIVYPSAGTTNEYTLKVLADETACINFYFDLETVTVTYHYNNGSNYESINEKYDISNSCYNLKSISSVTWYLDKDLTPANIVTTVLNNETVWACYNGNNDLATKFTMTEDYLYELGSFYKATYKATVLNADIIFPDYYNDIAIRKVNIDNLYNQNYSTLTMPSELEIIEYGEYEGQAISWIILDNENGTYKLLSLTSIAEALSSEASNIINNIDIDSNLNCELLSLEELETYTEKISNYPLSTTWWLIDRNPGGTGSRYVKQDGTTAISMDRLLAEMSIRPTLTITL